MNVVQVLLAAGADVEHRAGYGLSALTQAASSEHPAVVEALLGSPHETEYKARLAVLLPIPE